MNEVSKASAAAAVPNLPVTLHKVLDVRPANGVLPLAVVLEVRAHYEPAGQLVSLHVLLGDAGPDQHRQLTRAAEAGQLRNVCRVCRRLPLPYA